MPEWEKTLKRHVNCAETEQDSAQWLEATTQRAYQGSERAIKMLLNAYDKGERGLDKHDSEVQKKGFNLLKN